MHKNFVWLNDDFVWLNDDFMWLNDYFVWLNDDFIWLNVYIVSICNDFLNYGIINHSITQLHNYII